MKTLLLLRHGKSDWNDPDIADHDRPLNKRGKRDAPRMGRLVVDEHLLPDVIVTSTAKRARKTVEKLADAAGYTGKIEARKELYLASPQAYIRVLHDVPDRYQRVMAVGHNPGLEDLVELLTGTRTTVPTATLCEITLPIEHWHELDGKIQGQLEGVWRPRELP